MYLLLLKFKDAGWFPNHLIQPKDFIYDIGGKYRREKTKNVEPLTSNQISNVLHVLMGERPVPTYRKSIFKRDESIYQTAKNALVKINPYKVGDDLITETISSKKIVTDSYSNGELVTWELIRRLLISCRDKDLTYKYFISEIEGILNISNIEKVMNAEYACKLLRRCKDARYKSLVVKLKDNSKMPLAKAISEGGKLTYSSNPATYYVINRGITQVVNLSGEIIFRLTKEQLERIRNGKGSCTLLDGGLVYITDCVREDEFNLEELENFKILEV